MSPLIFGIILILSRSKCEVEVGSKWWLVIVFEVIEGVDECVAVAMISTRFSDMMSFEREREEYVMLDHKWFSFSFSFFLIPNKHHSFIKRKVVKTKSIKISLALAYSNGLGNK